MCLKYARSYPIYGKIYILHRTTSLSILSKTINNPFPLQIPPQSSIDILKDPLQINTFPLLSTQKLYREMKLHNDLKHPNIIELKKCFEDEKKIYIVLEYCENGVRLTRRSENC